MILENNLGSIVVAIITKLEIRNGYGSQFTVDSEFYNLSKKTCPKT